MRKQKSQAGYVILWLSVTGLLIVLIRSLTSRSISPNQIRSLIRSKLISAGYSPEFAWWWYGIARHETDDFKSKLFRQANNLFGMGYPTVGKDYGSIESSEGLKSKYPSVDASIDDLVEYLIAFKYPRQFETLRDLVEFMSSKTYFTAPIDEYYKGVRRFVGGGASSTW